MLDNGAHMTVLYCKENRPVAGGIDRFVDGRYLHEFMEKYAGQVTTRLIEERLYKSFNEGAVPAAAYSVMIKGEVKASFVVYAKQANSPMSTGGTSCNIGDVPGQVHELVLEFSAKALISAELTKYTGHIDLSLRVPPAPAAPAPAMGAAARP